MQNPRGQALFQKLGGGAALRYKRFMMWLADLLLVAALALVWRLVRRDKVEYEAFKALTDTAKRQAAYRRWTLKSFVGFGGFSLLALALLGRLPQVVALPPEFAVLRAPLAAAAQGLDLGAGFWGALVGGVLGGGIVGALLARRLKRAPVLGDIEPLLPRNGAERLWVALLGINAGLSEELFFRLALPLLVTLATGQPMAGFVAAGVIFGLVHLYQGWVGVLATLVLGALLAGLYLATGQLWVAIAVHALIDLNGLLLQPLLRSRLRKRAAG